MIAERYKVLLAVIEEQSLSGAASRMGYTPSGVSRMIATIEDEIGFKLFKRSKHGVVPTEECEALLPSVRKVLYYSEQFRQIASEFTGLTKGRLVIGTSYSTYYRWLSQVIAEFKTLYPDIDIDLIEKNSTHLTEAILNHEADIGIVSKREADIEWTLLSRDPMMAWVPKDSKYAEMGYVPIEAFESEPFINPFPNEDTDVKRTFEHLGITPNIRYAVTDSFAAICLIEAGLGISLMNHVTQHSYKGNIAMLPTKPEQFVDIGIATVKKENMTPAARKFIQFLLAKI